MPCGNSWPDCGNGGMIIHFLPFIIFVSFILEMGGKGFVGGCFTKSAVPRQRVAVQVEEVQKGKVKKKKNVFELDGSLCGSSLQLF